MISEVTNDFCDATRNTGNSIYKTDEIHRLAENNNQTMCQPKLTRSKS